MQRNSCKLCSRYVDLVLSEESVGFALSFTDLSFPEDFSTLRLLRKEGGKWVNV